MYSLLRTRTPAPGSVEFIRGGVFNCLTIVGLARENGAIQ
jgi:hypothetical protein